MTDMVGCIWLKFEQQGDAFAIGTNGVVNENTSDMDQDLNLGTFCYHTLAYM